MAAQPTGEWVMEVDVPDDDMAPILAAERGSARRIEAGEVDADTPLEAYFVLGDRPRAPLPGLRPADRLKAETIEGEHVVKVDVGFTDEVRDEFIARNQELRPGAEVRARIECGDARLAYVLFRDVINAFHETVLFRWPFLQPEQPKNFTTRAMEGTEQNQIRNEHLISLRPPCSLCPLLGESAAVPEPHDDARPPERSPLAAGVLATRLGRRVGGSCPPRPGRRRPAGGAGARARRRAEPAGRGGRIDWIEQSAVAALREGVSCRSSPDPSTASRQGEPIGRLHDEMAELTDDKAG